MFKKFFETAGFLLTVGCIAISIILGIRTGFMEHDVLAGVTTGGAFLLGVILFALGIKNVDKSPCDTPIAKVLWGTSLCGVAVLGVALVAMMLSDFVAISSSVIDWSLIVGAVMFLVPILLVAMYCTIKTLTAYVKEHKIFSVVTFLIALSLGTAMYFVTGLWSDVCATVCAFLFYWVGICFFTHAWKGVEYEESKNYWRIGFFLVITFLGCGILFIISQLVVGVPAFSSMLELIAHRIGVVSVYGLVSYIVLVVVISIARNVLRKCIN